MPKAKCGPSFILCAEGDALWYIGFRDELQASATQLKKFGVFSKVSFEAGHDTLAILGISGTGTAALLEQLGYTQPAAAGQLSSVAGGKLLRLADEHYLLILDFAHARQLLAEQSAYLAAPTLWLATAYSTRILLFRTSCNWRICTTDAEFTKYRRH